MASIIYDSMMDDLVRGKLNFETDSFYVMLVQSGYAASKANHKKRSDVTQEVGTTGTNYTVGGKNSLVTLTLSTLNHTMDIGFGQVTWSNATITARAAVIFKAATGSLPGVAANDPLVAYVDFGQDVSSTAAAFAVTFSSALRLQN